MVEEKKGGKKEKKVDPYWLQGKWEGEGTRMEGDIPIHFTETSEFKVISTEPETVMNYQQVLQDAKDANKCTAESGFWRIFPEKPDFGLDMLQLESSFLHPWGMNELSFGHIGLGDETGLPFAKLNAKEQIDFHRPKDSLAKEKKSQGGEVTHY